MIIRAATTDDAGCIAAIWNPQIRDTAVTFTTIEKTPEQLAVDITTRNSEGQAFLVAEEAGKVVGFATYFQFRDGPGYAHTIEHTVVLDSAARRRGTGRALISALEEQARKAGHHSMFAGVSSENPGGVTFHERIGYNRIATLAEVRYKFGRWMDLILLQKLL